MGDNWEHFNHMRGADGADPDCIHSLKELEAYVDCVGFLPLFRNSLPGFSVEEHVEPQYWWTGDPEKDPWEWRMQAAAAGRQVAYGKFFDKKAGFISLKWLPEFVNWRRDGYDFDARYDDGLASYRQKKIMDCFPENEEYYSFHLKELAGFGKGGEKNFEGTVTDLQMQTYLVMKDFRCRKNKMGEPYGWHIAVLATPESIWGRELVTSGYRVAPQESFRRIVEQAKRLVPQATETQIRKMIK